MTPSGMDAQFRDMSSLTKQGDDPVKLAQLREKHGITSVGPTLGVKLGLA